MTGIVDPGLSGSLLAVIATTPVALASAIALWFAFMPPTFYTRWLAGRTA